MTKVSEELLATMKKELEHVSGGFSSNELNIGSDDALQQLATATAGVATRHAEAAAKAEQDLSRVREAKLAQDLFNAQRALDSIATTCGCQKGMSLITAVPKLVAKVVADFGWVQEQLAAASMAVQRLASELDTTRTELEKLKAESQTELATPADAPAPAVPS